MSDWKSESIAELAKALAKAKGEFKPIVKETENPAYARGGKAMKYADLSTIIEATEKALAENGLSLIQSPDVNVADHSMSLIGMLVHTSGEWLRFITTLPAVQRDRFDAQSCGSSITYARRYQYKSIIGAAEEDDDGNAAAGIGSREAAKPVGDKKVAEFKANGNGHAAPPAIIPNDDFAPLLQKSIDIENEKKAKLNLPPIPPPEPPKPRVDARGADVDDVVGEIKSIKDLKTKENRPFKSVKVEDIFGGTLELSAFDNFKLSDGTLFQYLVAGAVGQQATFTYVSKEKNGKTFHNIINVSRIGNHRWDEGIGVLEQDAR